MKTFQRPIILFLAGFAATASLYGPPAGKGPGGGETVDHKALQSGPIKLGTSGGWEFDLANGYCCAGTLGSLIEYDGAVHILSNFHVLAADVVAGGNCEIATEGDPVIHPGLIDVGCDASRSKVVATLADAVDPLSGGNVDAATATVVAGAVDLSGAILGISEISEDTVAASIGQAVKKSGRTTGFTRSSVAYLDVTVSVAYENECAGGSAGTAEFSGQIAINNKGSKFLAGGDSGSLMVEDKADRPRAIGLLFAGSSSYAIANPIDEVLSKFGVSGATMVGLPGTGTGGTGGSGGGGGKGGPKNKGSAAELAKAMAANKKAAALARRLAKGVGHGVGVDEEGRAYIAIFVESLESGAVAPSEIDGVPVQLVETGRFVAF